MSRRLLLVTGPLLALALTACGQSAPLTAFGPTTAMVAQEQSLAQLVGAYKALDWNTDATRKAQLLTAIAATGSDASGNFLLGEYQAMPWSQGDRKLKIVAAIDALVLLDERATATSGMQAASFWHHGPSLTAIEHIGQVLQGDKHVPTAAKPQVDKVIAHIDIVAPHTSR